MKIKLKNKGDSLSTNHSYQGLPTLDWQDLNQGKEIEVKTIPEKIKDRVVEVSNKGGK
jgi:hypothetical protein